MLSRLLYSQTIILLSQVFRKILYIQISFLRKQLFRCSSIYKPRPKLVLLVIKYSIIKPSSKSKLLALQLIILKISLYTVLPILYPILQLLPILVLDLQIQKFSRLQMFLQVLNQIELSTLGLRLRRIAQGMQRVLLDQQKKISLQLLPSIIKSLRLLSQLILYS